MGAGSFDVLVAGGVSCVGYCVRVALKTWKQTVGGGGQGWFRASARVDVAGEDTFKKRISADLLLYCSVQYAVPSLSFYLRLLPIVKNQPIKYEGLT